MEQTYSDFLEEAIVEDDPTEMDDYELVGEPVKETVSQQPGLSDAAFPPGGAAELPAVAAPGDAMPQSDTVPSPRSGAAAIAETEEVMNSGMQFLAGMFRMATGKEIIMEGKAVEVDRETGEVVMRFRIPV